MVLRIILILFFFIFSIVVGTARADEPILGFYAFPDKSYIDMIANTPFKYLMPYGTDGKEEAFLEDYLNHAKMKGIKIIFSLKDIYKESKWYPKTHWCPTDKESELVSCIVERFKDYESVCGWYISDEPTDTVGLRNKEKIKTNAEAIKRSSSKPIFAEDYPLPKGKLWDYISGFSDILMTTSYPVPDRDIGETYGILKELSSKYENPVIAVVQAFGKYQYPYHKRDEVSGRPPIIEEIKVMSYLALMGRAKGILYYSLFDIKKLPNSDTLMASLKKLAGELKENYGIIASEEKVPDKYILKKEAGIFAKLTRRAGRDYLIAVNSTNEDKSIEITHNLKPRVIELTPLEVKILSVK
jgi:hypothetical protein